MPDVDPDREFLLRLVELGLAEAPQDLLNRALAVLVSATGAREAYLELWSSDEPANGRWSVAEGCDDARIDAIRTTLSRGIIAEAIATGKPVVTAMAAEDSRFRDRSSVKEHGIEAVLCVPIGAAEPTGVLYLQGRRGTTAFEPFSSAVRARVDLFARAMAPMAELLARRTADDRSSPGAGDAFDAVVARSPAMREVVNRLRLVAGVEVHVLLTGSSGVGKTLLARALHATSRRREAPFVEVNCAAIPEALLENELFGADAGAHSTAPRGGVRGKVEAADGGTLFLDEIGELSMGSQGKLLQLLNDLTYYRLGSSTLKRADVRIIAATNVVLQEAVRAKTFREDLYYRLKVFDTRVPSMAERTEDVIPLATHFCREAARRHGFDVGRLSAAAQVAVRAMEWPGNVRELAHRVESAVLHAHLRGARQVETRDLFPDAAAVPQGDASVSLHDATRAFQRAHVNAVLASTDWNVSEAARRLEIARSYLYTLVRAWDLKREA